MRFAVSNLQETAARVSAAIAVHWLICLSLHAFASQRVASFLLTLPPVCQSSLISGNVCAKQCANRNHMHARSLMDALQLDNVLRNHAVSMPAC